MVPIKPYYEDSEYYIWFSIFYLILSQIFLFFIVKRLLLKDRFNVIIWFFYPIFLFTLIIVDHVYKIIPFSPDSNLFTEIIKTGKVPTEQSLGVRVGFKYCTLIPRLLARHVPLYYLIQNFGISIFGGLLYWKAWMNYKKDNVNIKEQRAFILLLMIYPSLINFSLVPLRESYFLIAFAVFLLGVFKEKIFNIHTITGIILLFLLRRQFILLIPIILLIKIISRKKASILLHLPKYITLILLSFILLTFLANLINFELTPSFLGALKNAASKKYDGEYNYPLVEWKTYWDILLDAPLLVLQFFIAPFPVLVHIKSWSKIFAFFDGIYVVLLYMICLNKRTIYNYSLWIIIFLVGMSISGFFEFFMIAAVRHRFPFIIMLIPMAAEILSKKKYRIV